MAACGCVACGSPRYTSAENKKKNNGPSGECWPRGLLGVWLSASLRLVDLLGGQRMYVVCVCWKTRFCDIIVIS